MREITALIYASILSTGILPGSGAAVKSCKEIISHNQSYKIHIPQSTADDPYISVRLSINWKNHLFESYTQDGTKYFEIQKEGAGEQRYEQGEHGYYIKIEWDANRRRDLLKVIQEHTHNELTSETIQNIHSISMKSFHPKVTCEAIEV